MKWGDTQALLSVTIGLNLAYFTFREIRGPQVDSLRENIDKFQVRAQNSMSESRILMERLPTSERKGLSSLFFEFLKLHTLALVLRRNVETIVGDYASLIRVERLLGVPAIVVAGAAIVLLMMSTFRFDDMIPSFIVYAMIGVGFLPIIPAVAINCMVLVRIMPSKKKLIEIGERLNPAISRMLTYKEKLIRLEGDHDADQVIE